MSEIECRWCREVIRPNQTGGWYHIETPQHRSDQRCFLYAEPDHPSWEPGDPLP